MSTLKHWEILAIAVLSCLATPGAAWYVDAARPDDNGDGTTWGTAKKLLESGVGLANTNGGTVLVANGTYNPAAEVAVTNSITVSSVNGAGSTFVNGSGAHRCFNLNNVNAVVEGFTLTNGLAADGGGALITRGVMRNCRLIRNTASSGMYAGGGAHVIGPGIIEACLISNNAASAGGGWGGGLYLEAGAQAINCTNINNQAYIGAGAFMYNGATMSGCVVQANVSNGIAFAYQTATKPASLVVDCTISGNTGPMSGSRNGGGMYIYSQAGTTLVTRCTIANNWALNGGGAYVNSPYVVFDNCSIVSNTSHCGGGLWITGGYSTNTTFTNCLIANNLMTTNGFPVGGTPEGGGVTVDSISGVVEFDHCVISNNTSVETWNGAAGIAADLGGPVYLRFCRVVNNQAINYTGCGGLNLGLAGSYASNCVISGNSSSAGGTAGGVRLAAGGLYNCLVSGNTSAGYSGIYVLNQAGTIVDGCTVVGNSARAVYVPGTQAWVRNSIVVSNGTRDTDNFSFQYNGATGSVMGVSYSCSPTNTMTSNGNTTNEPAFSNYAGGDYRLTGKSPCVNTGTNEPWMNNTLDLDGHQRLDCISRQVDMGAYEWLPKITILSVY